MTDTPLDPLAPEAVDELLSARADGEFDAAARDLGMTPLDAQARLDATPGARERERALVAARDAIADAPPLDDVTRRRLVQRAAAPVVPARVLGARRSGRWLVPAGGIAAAIALVIGVVALAHSSGSGAKASSANASATAPTQHVTEASGQINSAADLRRFVRGLPDSVNRSATAPLQSENYGAAPTPTTHAAVGGLSAKTQASGTTNAKPNRDEALRVDCPATLAKQLHATSPVLATRTVRSQGTRAVVVLFVKDKRTLAVLYDPKTCVPLITYLSP
ncbi:MAG: hypothetical protein JWL83_4091 [Actinomycetia bacterium]|nr:hypothetical protein [Actinomycetes bacterium]